MFFRLWYRLRRPKLKAIVHDISRADWCWKGPNVSEQTFFDDRTAVFLSEKGNLNSPESWNDSSHSKLWLYNAHYFDDLNSYNYIDRKDLHLELINRWIEDNPPIEGNGWEPYPLSLRIVNWVKWFSRRPLTDKSHLESLSLQAEALTQQLEYHILGNHIFANAKALVFAGCFLNSSHSEKYLHKGLGLLDREISEQFLEDGAHFELSPMYHSILLWDLLELIDLAKTSRNEQLIGRLPILKNTAIKALTWLKSMTHPDGEISFFNDSAIGIAPSPKLVFNYASELNLCPVSDIGPPFINKSSGYTRIEASENVLIFDHGDIGPDYLPGHAHADSLSFELSVSKQRIFVNSGTSMYGISDERHRQRSTCAHNTVVVDGENSSEVWSGFRVARRARSKLLQCNVIEGGGATLEASHNGYKRLSGRVTHTRSIELSDKSLLVVDKLQGEFCEAVACFHLHPSIEVIEAKENLIIVLPNEERFSVAGSGQLEILESTWHPKFGESIPNKKITFSFSTSNHIMSFKRLDTN
nr:alginate lyase family protein [Vibrio agarivorans]